MIKFLGKEDHGEREEFAFEESKEKPKAKSYPHVSFGRYKNAKDPQVLLSEFSGPMRLGAREAKVNVSFSYLVAVQITDESNVAESPSPMAANRPGSGTLKSASAGESASSASPADNESVEDLVNHGIEKGKEGTWMEQSWISRARLNSVRRMMPLIITAPRPNGLEGCGRRRCRLHPSHRTRL